MPSKPAFIDLSAASIRELGLSPELERVLIDIQGALAENYRDSFVLMVQAINNQASALNRIQKTLELLINNAFPQIKNQIPPAIGVVPDGSRPDLASAIVVADPIGAGYTLSQTALAEALGITQADVSILVRAFDLSKDEHCAVIVRRGAQASRSITNYHPRAIEKLRGLILSPPSGMGDDAKSAIRRAKTRMNAASQRAKPKSEP